MRWWVARAARSSALLALALVASAPRPAAALSFEVRVEPCLSRFPSPGVGGEPLDCVPRGARVDRLRQDGAWTLVRAANGTVGWSLGRFLAPSEEVASPEPAAVVNVRPCLVRRPSPGAGGRSLDCLPYGTRVRKLRKCGDWSLARSDSGEVGWVEASFLRDGAAGERTDWPEQSILATLSTLPYLPVPAAPAAAAPSLVPSRRPARHLYPTARIEARPCLKRRKSADENAPTLDCVAHGTKVELVGRLVDRAQIRTADGRLGWVSGDKLAPRVGSPLLLTDSDVAHVERIPDVLPGTTEEAPGAAARERGLEVDKWATSDERPEGLMIVGLLRNMGTRVNTAVTLTVQVYDWDESLVLEQPATVDTTILMPGQGTRFEVTLPGVFAFRALKFDTSSVDFEVTDSELISRM